MTDRGRESSRWQPVIVALVVVLILISASSALKISSLQGQVSSLESLQSAQQTNMAGLENAVGALSSKVNELSSEIAGQIPPVASFYVTSACVSLLTTCEEDGVYSITVVNNGTVALPTGPVYLSFNDTTRRTSFSFNASELPVIDVGQGAVIVSDSWPASSGAGAKLSPGDSVVVQMWLGNLEGSSETVVMTCAVTTTTQTFTNFTVSTFTQTQTSTTCD